MFEGLSVHKKIAGLLSSSEEGHRVRVVPISVGSEIVG